MSFTGCESPALAYCLSILDCCEATGYPIDLEVCERIRDASRWRAVDFDCEPDANRAACYRMQTQRFAECRHRRVNDPYHAEVAATCNAEEHLPGPGEPCPYNRCAAPEGYVVSCLPGYDGELNRCSSATRASELDAPCSVGCVGGLHCNAEGLCAEPLPDGSECLRPDYCESGACQDERCVAPPAVGEAECLELSTFSQHSIYVGPAQRLFIAGSDLYLLELRSLSGHALWRASTDGRREPELVAENLRVDNEARLLALDEHYFYIARNNRLSRIDLSDGSLDEGQYQAADIGAVVVEDGGLWTVDRDCSTLTRRDRDQNVQSEQHAQLPEDLPFDGLGNTSLSLGEAIYCATDRRLFRYPRDGGEGQLLRIFDTTPDATGEVPGDIRALAAGPQRLALIQRRWSREAVEHTVRLLDSEGRDIDRFVVRWSGLPEHAFDASRGLLYSSTDEGIIELSLSDGSQRLLEVPTAARATTIGLTEDAVYFTVTANQVRTTSAILRVDRDL